MEPRATRLEVRISPGARRTGVSGRYGEAWKISVAAPAERGRANDALTTLLADELGVSTRSIRILSGHTTRTKVVEIDGLGAADVDLRLATAEKGARR